jgi:hypothetical protein
MLCYSSFRSVVTNRVRERVRTSCSATATAEALLFSFEDPTIRKHGMAALPAVPIGLPHYSESADAALHDFLPSFLPAGQKKIRPLAGGGKLTVRVCTYSLHHDGLLPR